MLARQRSQGGSSVPVPVRFWEKECPSSRSTDSFEPGRVCAEVTLRDVARLKLAELAVGVPQYLLREVLKI